MRKNILIDGREVPMEANGATPRLYRQLFGKDLLTTLHGAISKAGEVLDTEVFENLAFVMARQAGAEEENIDSWLSSFDSSMAITNAIKDIMALWRGNEKTTSTAKKKAPQQKGQ